MANIRILLINNETMNQYDISCIRGVFRNLTDQTMFASLGFILRDMTHAKHKKKYLFYKFENGILAYAYFGDGLHFDVQTISDANHARHIRTIYKLWTGRTVRYGHDNIMLIRCDARWYL
eukprot:682047_1